MQCSSVQVSRGIGLTVALLAATGFAAATYHDSLKEGDEALSKGNASAAIDAYEAALGHAKAEGERSLALAKKAYVLAYLSKDYPKARAAVDEALEVEHLAPVAKVTALQVRARCLMQADKDFSAAAKDLEEAQTLKGVDWALPALALAYGDCQRESGAMDAALEAYDKVIAMENASPGIKANAHLCSGFIHQYDRHDAAKARACYAAAVKLRPDLQKEVDGHLGRLP